jgi:hypothetical protein
MKKVASLIVSAKDEDTVTMTMSKPREPRSGDKNCRLGVIFTTRSGNEARSKNLGSSECQPSRIMKKKKKKRKWRGEERV